MALNDVPQSTQTLANSQPLIRTNFQNIDTVFEVDHVGYNDSGEGKHKKVTLPAQAVAPTFSSTDNGLYSKVLSTKNEMYIHKQTSAGTADIPFTSSSLSASVPASGSGGWTWLPSGMYIVSGSGNANGLTTVTITNPPPTQILNVQLTPFSTGITYQNLEIRLVDILSNSQFRIFGSVNGVAAVAGFSFLVTGY